MKYQVELQENKNGTVEVVRVFKMQPRTKARRVLKQIDKRQFTSSVLNSIEKFETK